MKFNSLRGIGSFFGLISFCATCREILEKGMLNVESYSKAVKRAWNSNPARYLKTFEDSTISCLFFRTASPAFLKVAADSKVLLSKSYYSAAISGSYFGLPRPGPDWNGRGEDHHLTLSGDSRVKKYMFRINSPLKTAQKVQWLLPQALLTLHMHTFSWHDFFYDIAGVTDVSMQNISRGLSRLQKRLCW